MLEVARQAKADYTPVFDTRTRAWLRFVCATTAAGHASLRNFVLAILVAGVLSLGALAGEHLLPLDEGGLPKVLQAQSGKVVLVDFWATWCGPCREELPLLAALERKWRDRGLVLITVSADEPEQENEALQLLKKTGVRLPAYLKRAHNDEAFINSIDRKWSGALPALFLYDRSGNKVRSFIGETEAAEIEAALSHLL